MNVPSFMEVGKSYQLEVETVPEGLTATFWTSMTSNATVTESGLVTILSVPTGGTITFVADVRLGSKTARATQKNIEVIEVAETTQGE